MKEAIEAFLDEYYRASGESAIAGSEHFTEPMVVIAGEEMLILQKRVDVAAFLGKLQIKAREAGMAAVTFENLSVHQLNRATVFCSVATVRRRADGSEIERVGTSYLLQNDGTGWKIRQLIATDLDKLV